MALLLSHLGSFTFKSSWLVLSLLFGSAGAVCPLPPVSEGAKLTTITHDGVSRSWYIYVPASVAAAQAVVPLVIDLHAIYQCVTQDDTQLYTGWLSKAEEFGFILVWPQAADEPIGENGFTAGARWNAGTCDECLCENCVYQGLCCRVDANATDVPSNNADDVAFLREVVAQVLSQPACLFLLAQITSELSWHRWWPRTPSTPPASTSLATPTGASWRSACSRRPATWSPRWRALRAPWPWRTI